MTIIEKDDFPFKFNQKACSSCSAICCRGSSGNIWVNYGEIYNICNLLGINIIDGMSRFFEKRENRYSVREIVDVKDSCCIFLNNDNQCSIYPARPLQCRTFPFWEYFKIHADKITNECPGIITYE
ncbi:Uncharacterized protein MCHI_002636 [Candidatus Magnetoovum chiemensis]|nr:Uncharacterized protein MCHI_002636 [Candidatus Magnetoovum chiemensis]